MNISIPRRSLLNVLLKESTDAFCQADPGSMDLKFEGLNQHYSAMVWLVISAPLYIRTNSGAP